MIDFHKFTMILENNSGRINDPEYTHYCYDANKGLIHSGWSYKEDAEEARRDAKERYQGDLKVYSKRYLVGQGKNPDDDKNWMKSHS